MLVANRNVESPRDIGVDFPRYEFLGQWIHPILKWSHSDLTKLILKILLVSWSDHVSTEEF